jgi:hypothetical protein
MSSAPEPLVPLTPKPPRRIARSALRLIFFVGLPVLLIPALFPRKLSAKKSAATPSTWTGPAAWRSAARDATLQKLVDDLRERLTIPNPVVVTLVQQNALLVSVERQHDHDGAFTLSVESGLIDGLSDEEVQAVVAHELGHVWIFTHHPYLQTELLANEVALRLVSRDVLERVYEKVWNRTGTKGTLQYLPERPSTR